MISDEDADRIAQAHTREQGRLMVRGCSFFLVVILIGAALVTLLYYLR